MITEKIKINLLDFSRPMLTNYFKNIGEPGYRASQVIKWVHQLGVSDFDLMTNLSKNLRAHLIEHCEVPMPEVVLDSTSADGTRKFLLKLSCGNCIETVFIPEEGRGTLCVSSQVGCSLNCTFCSTAQHGYNRNLKISEIIGQVYVAAKALNQDVNNGFKPLTNIVMMGMGEPLLNFDNVLAAMDIMRDDFAYCISKYRLTLSTSGVVPNIYKLAEQTDVALAISLHAPTDELRTKLVPLNKKYPISELMQACRDYFKKEPKRSITIEYVMLKNMNDQPEHARALIKLLKNMKTKINLIPFNTFPGTHYECSDLNTINTFRKILVDAGMHAFTRKTRGDDIDAACGQLAGEFHDRARRSKTHQTKASLRLQDIQVITE